MPVEVVMPKFGLTMQEGTIQQWFKTEGDPVDAGERLYEVETEKVLYEVEAPASGVIAKLLYPVEAAVACGRAVAVIALAGEDRAVIAAQYATEPSRANAQPRVETAPPAAARGAGAVATPAARKLAKDRGIDLGAVRGTGPGGRISREDVEAALSQPPAAASARPLSGMRKAIAERMWKSLHASAQVTITAEVDVTPLVQRRAALRAEGELTYTDLIIEAVAAVLPAHPRVRQRVSGDGVAQAEGIHIGIAVALDDGLVVPVIRDADRKSIAEIAAATRTLTEKARLQRLAIDDVADGVFTITNLGAYGVDAFTPIIHQPQVAILGVGRIVEKPAVHDGQIAVRSLLTLSLTFDHRVIDGAPAAAFLRDVARQLAAPASA